MFRRIGLWVALAAVLLTAAPAVASADSPPADTPPATSTAASADPASTDPAPEAAAGSTPDPAATYSTPADAAGSTPDPSSTGAATATPTDTPTETPTSAPPPSPGATPTPTPSRTVPPLAVALPANPVLTLPASDGFRDVVTAVVTAPTAQPVSMTLRRGTRAVVVTRGAVPVAGSAGFTVRVRVPTGNLTAGSWRATVAQGSAGATATHLLRVGSGIARHVTLTAVTATAYPRSTGAAAHVSTTVQATDETGAGLPAAGTIRITAGRGVRSATVRRSYPARGSVSVVGLREGYASLVARVAGPAGGARLSASRSVRLAATVIRRTTITPSWPTVQPIIDDQLDTVTLSARGWSSSGVVTPVVGSITVTRGRILVRSWSVHSTATTKVVWDGRTGGRVVPGDYTITVRERGPEGTSSTSHSTVTVTDVHLPYRIRVIARLRSGNQQGLGIGPVNGVTRVFATVDVGGGESRIDEYELDGRYVTSSPSLRLGHGAEIAVSADGLLAVANGGPTAETAIFLVNPASWTVDPVIPASPLGPNGMVAAQPGGGFIVFAGKPGAYRLTPMSADGTLGASVPVPDAGVPQGLEVVKEQVWLFSSLVQGNRITKLDPSTGAVLGTTELAMRGEGEGEAIDPATGLVYVGCHSPNRFGVLERVSVR